jgi:hypothetical protein
MLVAKSGWSNRRPRGEASVNTETARPPDHEVEK